MQPFNVMLKPILSEKSAKLRDVTGQYTFVIRMDASKEDVAKALQKMFDVKVDSVRTMITRHRARRRGNKMTSPRRVKKAIVTLAKGSKIPLFEDQ